MVKEWMIADLIKRFSPIPLHRIRKHPAPGTATERDLVAIHDHEDCLCELVDSILVEKTRRLDRIQPNLEIPLSSGVVTRLSHLP